MKTLSEVQRDYIVRVLERSATLEEAAEILGVNLSTLWRFRKRYGIKFDHQDPKWRERENPTVEDAECENT